MVSVGVISTILVLKAAIIPYSSHLIISTIPRLWMWIRSWLTPPYIYIILNFIIITIAASSTFHHHQGPHKVEEQKHHPTEKSVVALEEPTAEIKNVWLAQEQEKKDVEEKSPAEGESMEETWKAIMEAKGKEGAPQLKKSETWNTPPQVEEEVVAEMRKSESEKFTVREKSEELNRRVEAFIIDFSKSQVKSINLILIVVGFLLEIPNHLSLQVVGEDDALRYDDIWLYGWKDFQ
ncbi:protein of unknown function DUF4408 [Dillenia turbinata]|uniref:DUF4408 domain-containing protein n=1 Tax=Dillenia turbinata TaxID=194707 RepID=A0AAN8YZX4_9MAGN